jgi:hypothetical protein
MSDSVLHDRGPVIATFCSKCGRSGQYRYGYLLGRHGTDVDLAAAIAKDAGCPRAIAAPFGETCGMEYIGRRAP